ncbi:MAG: ABC transporter permease [Lewinellaceae bacterium]|nr:ABC transporter permease [Phaeodactylibacter sp.]MCB9349800.1 ABC transporter permease [Lewinellaceae bacterium]
MIKHLIQLIWNKKRSNFLLTTEIFASFIVLFGVMSLVFYNYGNYVQPLGYDYEDVWAVYFTGQDTPDSVFSEALERAKQQVVSYPEIDGAALCTSNTPYSQTTMRWNITYEGKSVLSEMILADENLASVLNMPLEEGRWMDRAEVESGQPVVVLNRQAKEALFGDEPALGKMASLSDDGKFWKVVGVLGNFKAKGEFQELEPVVFINHQSYDIPMDVILLNTNEGADAVFEAALLKGLNRLARGANIELSYLTSQRRNQHAITKAPMIIAATVCGFLLLNVGLGLLGVLWFNIRKRRGEIGLRRALGATRGGILVHFVSEAVLIAAFAILVGLFFAGQFPLLGVFGLDASIYLSAALASVGILVVLVAACAFVPSREAAQVQPAMVLHEE